MLYVWRVFTIAQKLHALNRFPMPKFKCLTLGLENRLNAMILTSWEGSCPDIEAVEISSVSLPQESKKPLDL